MQAASAVRTVAGLRLTRPVGDKQIEHAPYRRAVHGVVVPIMHACLLHSTAAAVAHFAVRKGCVPSAVTRQHRSLLCSFVATSSARCAVCRRGRPPKKTNTGRNASLATSTFAALLNRLAHWTAEIHGTRGGAWGVLAPRHAAPWWKGTDPFVPGRLQSPAPSLTNPSSFDR